MEEGGHLAVLWIQFDEFVDELLELEHLLR